MKDQYVPTEDEINASVEANIRTLRPHLEHLTRLIKVESKEVVEMEAPMPVKHQRLLALIEEAAALVAPVTPCKDGCSACCHMAVAISSHEADLIAQHLGITRANPPMNLNRGVQVDEYMNVPCVFLKKGRCAIYEVRPIPCRTHFNLSAYPVQCDTLGHPGLSVPNVDWSELWGATAAMHVMGGCTLTDIREFFPNGVRNVQSL